MYDIVIIGGGIAGLYSAYKIHKTHPHLTCMILEKNSELGGRIHYEELNHEEMKEGGGFLRTTDTETIRLLDEIQIPYYFTRHPIQYTFKPVHVMKMMEELRVHYMSHEPIHITFEEYARSIWGQQRYNQFIKTTMYIDYRDSLMENVLTDVSDFMYNVTGYTEGIVDWNHMIYILISRITCPMIKNCTVMNIVPKNAWTIHTSVGTIQSRRIILATNVTSARKLLPTFHLLRYIHPSSCTKIFVKVADSCIKWMKIHVPIHTIVDSILHNIMPIDPEKGIYLIGYSDEEQADELSSYVHDSLANRTRLARLAETSLLLPVYSLSITRIVGKYWPCAMHKINPAIPYTEYRECKHAIQCPLSSMRIVGEMTAIGDGGWIADAIQSTDVITQDWLDDIVNVE